MIIVMKAKASEKELQEVLNTIKEFGYQPHPIYGTERTVIGAVGSERGKEKLQALEMLPGVEKVVPILQPYKLASREVKPEKSVIAISDTVQIGGDEVVVIAGPCSIENEQQIIETARGGKGCRGNHAARRSIQTPHLTLTASRALREKGLCCWIRRGSLPGFPWSRK